jgi:hypothetical protein
MGFDLNEYYSKLNGGDVLMAFKGNISGELISNVLEVVEAGMDDRNENSKIRKKVYNVLVESLQNLYHHIEVLPPVMQKEFDSKFAMIVVSKETERYRLSTGNFVTQDKVDVLKNKIDKINSMGKEELKDMYKFILNHQRLSEKGGGGLGLVDIARKTGHKLEYHFEKYNNIYYFFNLDVFVEIS